LFLLEGLDGAGKSTVCNKLSKYFNSLGESTIVRHEPCECKIFDLISSTNFDLETKFFLYSACSKENNKFVRSNLKLYDKIFLDRSLLSSYAYQIFFSNINLSKDDFLSLWSDLFFPLPKIIFYMRLTKKQIPILLNRLRKKNDNDIRTESEYERIIEAYEYLFDLESFAKLGINLKIMDSSISEEEIFNTMRGILSEQSAAKE